MTTSPITVRSLATLTERELHFHWADQAFSPNPSPTSVQHWTQFVTTMPEYRPEQLRGAFRDGEQLGSYIFHERTLRMGAARLPTGCIGAVVTYPAYRHQGVATALMQDAIDYASSHRYPLLLLDGIPKFYYRYGYTDMFDQSTQDIDRAAILAQPPSPLSVRPAIQADAASILTLYERHFGSYTGSFTRTVEKQAHRLQFRSPDNPIWLAVDSTGRPQGFLSLRGETDRSQAQELAADTWSAALALLQHHAQLLDGPEAPATLRYRMTPTAPILQWMIDHLEVRDTSHWHNPAEEWVVQGRSYHHRFAGWMARLVSLPVLAEALLPEWQARWHRSLAHWSGSISLQVGEEDCTLHIDGTQIQLDSRSDAANEKVQLSPQAFIQLVFGYRPVTWVAQQMGQLLKSDLLSVLGVLFPAGHTWIPSSDWF
jgi:predicted N-acetyltransferase YhbS